MSGQERWLTICTTALLTGCVAWLTLGGAQAATTATVELRLRTLEQAVAEIREDLDALPDRVAQRLRSARP